jgi:hypothetical protein
MKKDFRTIYKTHQICFQTPDEPPVDFIFERDHPLIERESHELIQLLLS